MIKTLTNRITKLVLMMILITGAVGCGSTPQERIDGLRQFLGVAREQSEMVNDDIATMQKTLTDLQAAAADPGLSGEDAEKIKAALTAASEKLTAAVAAKEKIDKAIIDAEAAVAKIAEGGSANIGDEIAAIGQTAVAASQAIPPPYGAIVGIVGTLIGAIGAAIGRRYKVALVDTVASVDAAKGVLAPEQESAVNATLKTEQSGSTRTLVRAIRTEAAQRAVA